MIWSFKFLDVYVLIKSNDLLLCYLFIKFVIFVINLMSSRNLGSVEIYLVIRLFVLLASIRIIFN
jgi:hypothetical protein